MSHQVLYPGMVSKLTARAHTAQAIGTQPVHLLLLPFYEPAPAQDADWVEAAWDGTEAFIMLGDDTPVPGPGLYVGWIKVEDGDATIISAFGTAHVHAALVGV